MNEDTHVYCVKCKNLKFVPRDEYFPASCRYEKECDFTDIEDSRCFSDRPFYQCANPPHGEECLQCKNSSLCFSAWFRYIMSRMSARRI